MKPPSTPEAARGIPLEQRAAGGAPAVELEGVSVQYRVPFERVLTFKEFAIRCFQRRLVYQDIHALRNVSVSVPRGQSLGIIGPNGAGKSTLLKLVARVLRPTSGRVIVRGRVVPLMEIGAGFHPELTGRENTLLYGAMLGHRRADVARRLDHIFDFAEIGRFVDAPLRTYSSGMIARLGFAVATAWDADVLIIDEALATGDEAFQEKCGARLETFRRSGATVLLALHNSETVRRMCSQAVWLDQGVAVEHGPSDQVVSRYLKHSGLSGSR